MEDGHSAGRRTLNHESNEADLQSRGIGRGLGGKNDDKVNGRKPSILHRFLGPVNVPPASHSLGNLRQTSGEG